ncbi:hypothetical protein N4G58_05165 [Edwardsiella piscicida]|nr:hypothetical protein N4G58_05165 [Edwardsiella piscicida]
MSDKSDERTVSRATILGFIIATVLFVLVSIIPFGVFSQGELATMSPLRRRRSWRRWWGNGAASLSILA